MVKRRPKQTVLDIETKFVMAYLRHPNATEAALAAGIKKESAAGQGRWLLHKPRIAKQIKDALAKNMEEANVDVQRLLREVERLALVDVGKAFDDNQRLLPMSEMPESVRRCIASIDVETLWEGRGRDREAVGTLTKVRFWDKTASINLLGKYLRMWAEAATGKANDPVHTVSNLDFSWADKATLQKLAEGGT